jgi:hypothetical protein
MLHNEGIKKDRGLVFIVEGNAERQFYEKFTEYICDKYVIAFEKKEWNYHSKITDNLLITTCNDITTAIYFQDCTAGSQLPLQKDNIINIVNEYFISPKNFGVVFVCFDIETNKTRPYDENDIDAMIEDLKIMEISCTKIKADNTIEDIMLYSYEEIVDYLGIDKTTKLSDIRGKKGDAKMERLYDMADKKYKGAGVIKGLVEILNMQKILDRETQLQQIVDIIKANHNIN